MSWLKDVRIRTTDKSKQYYSGVYQVINREKYLGLSMPEYRSSYEKRALKYFDLNQNVIKWGYENLKIRYNYELDGKAHNYITDFYAEIRDKSGNIQKYIIEIKPSKSLKAPQKPKNPTGKAMKNYLYSLSEFVKNKNKWNAAEKYCQANGMKFTVLTEEHLF